MSEQRKELDQFLNHSGTKISTNIVNDIMSSSNVDVELKFYDISDANNDEIISSTTINVDFNNYNRIETTEIELMNQCPEFILDVLKHKYEIDEKDKEDNLKNYDDIEKQDAVFMEAVASKVLEDIENDYMHIMYYGTEKSEIDVDDIEIDIKSSEIIEYDVSHEDDALMEIEYQYEADLMVDDQSLKVIIDLDKRTDYSDKDILVTEVLDDETNNELEKVAIQAIKARGFNNPDQDDVFSLVSKIEEEIENQLKEDQKPEEPKQKQKKSKGFGMSM